MDTNEPTPTTATPVSRGILGTNIPTTIAFGIAVILFFMPFIDIKCNDMTLQSVTGIQLATGFDMKEDASSNSLFNNNKNKENDGNFNLTKNSDKKDPNLFAILAVGLAVLGFGLSLIKSKAAISGTMVTGILAAGVMVALFLDIKKKVRMDTLSGGSGNDLTKGIDDFGKSVTDKLNIVVDFTAWYYIAAIAFLAAAYFSYKRMSEKNK